MGTVDEELVTLDARCFECKRKAVESRLVPGNYYLPHSGTCSHNDALHVCKRCDSKHVDLDFGRALACIMDTTLDEARDLQQRIVDRLTGGEPAE